MSSTIKSDVESLTGRYTSNKVEDIFAGSFTTSLYDTAWIACIRKDDCWLFPGSFQYILQHQLPSGLWQSGSSTSAILNGLGGLYALLQHAEYDRAQSTVIQAERAQTALREALQSWDMETADGVAFEVLIPAMLDLLANKSLAFEFPGKEALLLLNKTRMSKLSFDRIYERGGVILHSIEAFYGAENFDFDRLRRFKIDGSLMASPAASAAYLMRTSSWDGDTEAYLRRTLGDLAGGSDRGVPSAYPTMAFELSWATTTLLDQGWDRSELPKGLCEGLLANLEDSGALDGRCVGFMAGVEADLDDTAKSSIALNLLGKRGLSRSMIVMFDKGTHCSTYAGERNISPSANCNALYALLLDLSEWKDCQDMWSDKVNMLLTYLVSVHWNSHNVPLDKWNHSPWYSLMLLVQSLTKAIASATIEPIARIPTNVKEQAALLLSRSLAKAFSEQRVDGSWGRVGPYEETAYVVLLLSFIQQSNLFPGVMESISLAIAKAQHFLKTLPKGYAPEALWIEKVDYGSALVAQCYVLAASSTPLGHKSPPSAMSSNTIGINNNFVKMQAKAKIMFKQLPLLQDCPEWVLDLSGVEAGIYFERLKRISNVVLTRQGFTEDKYLAMIPFIWTVANNFCGVQVSCDFLFQMMVLSFLNYQIDEFMETAIGGPESELRIAEDYIQTMLFDNDAPNSNSTKPVQYDHPMQAAFETLHRYKDHALSHVNIIASGPQDQNCLKRELKRFLLAHVAQNRDNEAIRQHKGNRSANANHYKPLEDFQSWLRGTAATHTSCAFSFAFAKCLMGSNHSNLFDTLEQEYIMEDLVQHLAIMCRLYNDIGSLARDKDESNLNCADFEQVRVTRAHNNTKEEQEQEQENRMRLELLTLAYHERRVVETCLQRLTSICSLRARKMLHVFIATSDLFSQMYVIKDLSSRRLT